jgi:hypothetical protein
VSGPGAPDLAVVGPWVLEGRLGEGGMGVVYRGRRRDGGTPVAVKVIRSAYADDPEFRARFAREAAAAGRVASFCTARVLDADVDGPRPYIVSELVDGPSLADRVEAAGPLPEGELEGLAVGVAGALVAIHAAGIVHRDLTPGNVMLTGTGPRVIDFGIARAVDAVTRLTVGWPPPGTPSFMAPELFDEHEPTPAADVFSMGALLAFAGTGRLPFGEGSDASVAYRVRTLAPDLHGLPGRLRPLVERAMAKDPAARPTAPALLAELTGAPPPPPQSPAVPARRVRRPLALAAAGLALVVLAALGIGAARWAGDEPADSAAASWRPPAGLDGAPVFSDDFSGPVKRWAEERLDENGGFWLAEYRGQAYRIGSTGDDPALAAPIDGTLRASTQAAGIPIEGPRAVRVAVDVVRADTNQNGELVVLCQTLAAGDSSYRLVLAMDGQVRIGQSLAGAPAGIVLASGRIPPPAPDRPGRLEAYCAQGQGGTHLALLLDGTKVLAVDDPGQPDGGGFSVKVGVSGAPGSSGWFEATFDNYSIWMQP